MLDVRKLLLLRELARRDTIAAVAEALCYTPSAVSQQLAALERYAGVPLLQRTGRRVSLTPAGAALAGQTEEILALLERAAAGLAAVRTGLTGPLRIGAFPTAMRTILPAALVALGRDHPGLELMVTELDPAAVPDALRSGALDVALVHEYEFVPAPRDPALDTEPLLEEAIYLASAGPQCPTRCAPGRSTSRWSTSTSSCPRRVTRPLTPSRCSRRPSTSPRPARRPAVSHPPARRPPISPRPGRRPPTPHRPVRRPRWMRTRWAKTPSAATAIRRGSWPAPARSATRWRCARARQPGSLRASAITPTTSSPCSRLSPPGRAWPWCRSSARSGRRPASC